MELLSGDIIKSKSIKAILPANDIISGGWMNWKVTDKKTRFLFMFLGIENDNNEDTWEEYEHRLNLLGWVYDPEKALEKVRLENEI